jgi:hypothetical protein
MNYVIHNCYSDLNNALVMLALQFIFISNSQRESIIRLTALDQSRSNQYSLISVHRVRFQSKSTCWFWWAVQFMVFLPYMRSISPKHTFQTFLAYNLSVSQTIAYILKHWNFWHLSQAQFLQFRCSTESDVLQLWECHRKMDMAILNAPIDNVFWD